MRKIATIALLLTAATSTGMAAETPASLNIDPSEEVRVGLGVACDTEDQIERYASLIGAKDSAEALQIVNDEAQNPRACGAVAIAYKISKQVTNVRNEKGSFRIVEIVVIAAASGNGGWQMVDPHPTQYIAVREIEA